MERSDIQWFPRGKLGGIHFERLAEEWGFRKAGSGDGFGFPGRTLPGIPLKDRALSRNRLKTFFIRRLRKITSVHKVERQYRLLCPVVTAPSRFLDFFEIFTWGDTGCSFALGWLVAGTLTLMMERFNFGNVVSIWMRQPPPSPLSHRLCQRGNENSSDEQAH
ncbi:MAG: hypothetical protein ABIT37_13465 [Luteolibacter sp.]